MKLADHIYRGRGFKHEGTMLKPVEEDMADALVAEDLHKVLLKSIEKGLGISHRGQLDTIREFRKVQQFSANVRPDLHEDIIIHEILPHLLPDEIQKLSKELNLKALTARIKSINEMRLPIKTALPGMSAQEAVDWLIKNQSKKNLLKHADW